MLHYKNHRTGLRLLEGRPSLGVTVAAIRMSKDLNHEPYIWISNTLCDNSRVRRLGLWIGWLHKSSVRHLIATLGKGNGTRTVQE